MSIELFEKLFSGNKEAYGQNNFCMKAKLTRQNYRMHLEGKQRLGIYPIYNSNLVKFAAVDYDIEDFSVALNIKNKCVHYKLSNVYIERSKSKGYHIFLFFEEPVEAYKPRLILKHILKELDIRAEIFPKSSETNAQTPLGNFLFIPLFGGSVADKRTIFIDDAERAYVKNVDELTKIKLNSIAVLDEIIEMNDLREEDVVRQEAEIIVSSKVLPCIDNIKNTPLKEHDGRNECGFRLAIYYKQKGLAKDDVFLILNNWDLKNINSLGKRELKTILDSVFKGGYRSYGCDSAIIQAFCDKANCPIILAKDRKARIDAGLITLTYRDEGAMIFKKLNYEYRLTNIEANKKQQLKATVTLSKDTKVVYKDSINFEKALPRKRFATAVKDESVNVDLIKIEDLCRKKIIEEHNKEEEEKPKQLYIMTEEEKKDALHFLEKTHNILYEVIKTTNNMGIVGEETLRLVIYLCFTSRISKTPLSLSVKGESSSGKSFLCERVMRLIPEEGYFFMTEATKQAFFHLPEDALEHRIVFIAELIGAQSADYSIRTAQSEGNLVLLMPVKDPNTGDMMTKEKKVRGPVGFLLTTTKASLFSENETRNFSIFTDDSPALTSKITDIIAQKAMGEEFNVSQERLNLFRNIQRLLNSEFKVIMPFAKEVFKAFPNNPVRIRRDGERFRILIEIIAILHQFQRKQYQENGRLILEATIADYYLAKLIVGNTLLHTIYEIGPASQTVWDTAQSLYKKAAEESPEESFEFGYKEIIDAINWKYDKVKKWTITLLKAGYLEYAEGSSGGRGKTAKYKLSDSKKSIAQLEVSFLPSVEELFKLFPCDESLFYNPISGAKVDPRTLDAPFSIKFT